MSGALSVSQGEKHETYRLHRRSIARSICLFPFAVIAQLMDMAKIMRWMPETFG